MPKEFLDYEVEYYCEYKLDEDKLCNLPKSKKDKIVFSSLISETIPEEQKGEMKVLESN